MKGLLLRLLGLFAALLVTGLSFVSTAYADNGGGYTHPPEPMSVSK